MNAYRIPALLLCLLFALPALAQQEVPAATGTDANKAVVKRYIEEVLSAGQLEKLEELVAPEFVDSTPEGPAVRGPEAVRIVQKRARERFEGIRYTIDQLVAEGDKVVARYIVLATLKASDKSSAAGKSAEFAGMTIFRIVDGKIRETWIINDQIELFRQLGYTLTPPK